MMVVILLFGLHARGNRPCNFLSKATKQTLKKTIIFCADEKMSVSGWLLLRIPWLEVKIWLPCCCVKTSSVQIQNDLFSGIKRPQGYLKMRRIWGDYHQFSMVNRVKLMLLFLSIILVAKFEITTGMNFKTEPKQLTLLTANKTAEISQWW